ncbi:HdeA/HdeB family chaperone [Xanthobacter autotrophicus DSM 431]|uniref:HdeA/HdeB family chaperone n=1 Tax=Xanthobacter nonsaccharivorans TaxID=3119912 RepID=UPI00372B8BF3
MKHVLALAVLIAGLSPAAAEKWDLSTMTCQQFINSDKTTISIILTWLDAYYKDEDASPVIDTDKFVKNAEKLAAFCATSPNLGLITAADEVFD